jgi:hypothetical protein
MPADLLNEPHIDVNLISITQQTLNEPKTTSNDSIKIARNSEGATDQAAIQNKLFDFGGSPQIRRTNVSSLANNNT